MKRPIPLINLKELISLSEKELEPAALRLWHLIQIPPVKWAAPEPWGKCTGGFWVVALFGESALWFNDIEGGFNISRYESFGTLPDYRCNQDELFHVLNRIHCKIETGEAPSYGDRGFPMPFDE